MSYLVLFKFYRNRIDEKVPKPPGPPSGGGGNTNACNSLCRAMLSDLQLISDLNAAGLVNVRLHFDYDETPNNPITISVTNFNLQTCTIRGVEKGGTGANKTISWAFAFANSIDMQVS
ncbi:hypothetical protein BK704_12180 [[Bacillus thuringiensis] serovar konkukian]|nr:hypothetical protein [Bacillus thuringiensis]MED1302922.1 hypothetical protein [Bacillus pacificus]OUB09058.1 hypothetical protein BK704_12180 [[Bacillus thuringiensis] serovar konkukian]